MNSCEITEQLNEIANCGDDLVYQLYRLTERWENDRKGFEAVELILRFMESHPDLDYGSPGPLIHFVEAFSDGYEEKLIESVKRHPIPHTIWMLNGAINGKKELHEREALISILKQIAEDALVDTITRERAAGFIEWQERSVQLDTL